MPGMPAGFVPNEIKEQVRHANDIVEVIETYVPLKKSGSRLKACCPFHKEKTPSFQVDPAGQMFYCFGCHVGGDVFKFVQLYENLDFPAALRRLAARAGITIQETNDPAQRERNSQREQLYKIHSAVAAWWSQILRREPMGEPGRAYLKSRSINSNLAREFSLGFAPPGWDDTLQWLKGQGFSTETMLAAGLIKARESGGYYDAFRGRLMFPIANETGQIVAFSGRLLDPEAKAAKYVNSPETPIFTKSRILFGLDKTKRAILDQRRAVVCEGQIDMIRCFENGISNVVASQGTAFTESHGQILKRYADEVILCFDSDRAGQEAAVRSIEVLLECGIGVRIAQLLPGEDPDTLLLKKGREAMEKILSEAPEYTRYLMDRASRENDMTTPRGRGAVAERMAAVIRKIPNPVQQQALAQDVATRLQVPVEEVWRQVGARRMTAARNVAEKPKEPEATGVVLSPLVRDTLSFLLLHPAMVPQFQRALNPIWLEGQSGGEWIIRLTEAHANEEWETAGQFIDLCAEAEKSVMAKLVFDPIPIPPDADLSQYTDSMIGYLRKAWNQRRRQILQQEIKSKQLSSSELKEKEKELLDLLRSGF